MAGRATLMEPSRQRQRGRGVAATITIARWCLRQSWRQLLVAELGLLGVVSLICAAPLFSQVAINAGLRGALTSGAGGASVTVFVQTNSPSTALSKQVLQLADPLIRHAPPSLRVGLPRLSVQAFELHPVASPTGNPGSGGAPGAASGSPDNINLIGASIDEAASHVTLLEGALPDATSDEVQIAVTRATADSLHLHTGSRLDLAVPSSNGATLPLRVTGIFTLASADDPYFGDVTFQPSTNGPIPGYSVLASNDALMVALARAGEHPPAQQSWPLTTVSWSYPLDISNIDASQLGAMTNWAQALLYQVPPALNGIPGVRAYADPTLSYQLQQYQSRIVLLQIPIALILIQVLGLVVLFVTLTADLLIESQAAQIALLRSRGANRGVIFRALGVQGVGLGLLALAAGPFVAVALVVWVAQRALPPGDLSALGTVADDPVRAAVSVAWFALGAALLATGAMIAAVRRAVRLNVVALRREAARATHESAWKKLHLDFIGLGLALAGYIGYAALVAQVDSQSRLTLSPLSFIAALFLLGAAAMLFLRVFPGLLRLAAWVALRSRAAAPTLAFVQLARAPRQAARIILLLGLATAFLIFASIFDASQAQRPMDEAAYHVGADFRGTLAHPLSGETLSAATAPYVQLAGVSAAAAGYTAVIDSRDDKAGISVALHAVDADTFSRAALWTPQDPPDTLAGLMDVLTAGRAHATAVGEVPAVIDAAFSKTFHVQTGDHITLAVPGYTSGGMRFVVAAQVRHIPGIYDNADQNGYGSFGGTAGLLVDYASYTGVYAADHASSAVTSLAPNTIWLRTSDDPAILAALREVLGHGDLALSPLLDRRQEIAAAEDDPLRVDLVGVLRIGAAAALLLALVGSLVTSWVSARSRVTQFALLRALGTDPRQLSAALAWEQALIYVLAFALGIGLGAILSTVVLPTLVFANLVSRDGNAFVRTLDVPPVRMVIPFSELAMGLGGVAILCVLALIVTALVIALSSVSQSLRLNED